MSRSNPSANSPNPAVRWFEWHAQKGVVRYYDKDTKAKVEVLLPFKFLLLDELATVKGWHEKSGSGIYSNEVRDTRKDVMVVKAFKGGVLAEGLYRDIKDRVNALGGKFVANCYIAFKEAPDKLAIGSLRFKTSSLGAWMEFRKEHRKELLTKAIVIASTTEGKKGAVTFHLPAFTLKDTSPETNTEAMALDRELQTFLEGYFKRRTSDQTEQPAPVEAEGEDYQFPSPVEQLTDDDIPF